MVVLLPIWLAGILDSSCSFLLCWVYGSYISLKPYVMIPGRAVNHSLFTASESRSIYRAALVMGNFLRVMGKIRKESLAEILYYSIFQRIKSLPIYKFLISQQEERRFSPCFCSWEKMWQIKNLRFIKKKRGEGCDVVSSLILMDSVCCQNLEVQ